MESLALAFVAGLVTLLNPCVLPLLPVVVGSALQAGRLGPVALGAGLALSFALFGTLVTAFGFAIGLDAALLRQAGAALLLGAGVVLLVPPAQAMLATAAGPLVAGAGGLAARMPGEGLLGQAAVGAVLGLVWSPCVGPTLGAAIGAAAQGDGVARAGLTMLVFGLGAASTLILFAQGARGALAKRRQAWSGMAARAKPLFGGALVLVGGLILTGLDKRLEAALVTAMPDWLVAFTTRW